MAQAMYDEPIIGCDACHAIGSDENCHFWCSVCKGQGWVVDEENVPVARDFAETNAVAALDALLVARQDEVCGTCGGTGKVGGARLDHPLAHYADDDPEHFERRYGIVLPDHCPDCIDGRVSGGPLMILGPKQVGDAELLRKMLVEADSLLSLAIYRNEHDQEWKDESRELVGRIRRLTNERAV